MTDVRPAARRRLPQPVILIGIGLAAGLCSGMFGVGGGLLIVPGLVLLAGFPQRLAAGTSLIALSPVSIAGVVSYSSFGAIDWPAALILALGVVVGGLAGARLARRVPVAVITIMFSALLVAASIRLILGDPTGGGRTQDVVFEVAVLIATGLFVGLISGLVGAGSGVLIVPALVLILGFDNLLARGVSLLGVFPNGLTGGLIHWRHGNVDLRAALTIGAAGMVSVVVGSVIASHLSGDLGSILFGVFLLVIAAHLITRLVRSRRTRGS